MAEAESLERIRAVLRETAAQYQKLADYLSRPDEPAPDPAGIPAQMGRYR